MTRTANLVGHETYRAEWSGQQADLLWAEDL